MKLGSKGERTVSPSQALVSHHRPQGFIARWLWVIVSGFVEDVLHRFMVGDPEDVLLLPGQVCRVIMVRRCVYPQSSLDTDDIAISLTELGLGCPAV